MTGISTSQPDTAPATTTTATARVSRDMMHGDCAGGTCARDPAAGPADFRLSDTLPPRAPDAMTVLRSVDPGVPLSQCDAGVVGPEREDHAELAPSSPCGGWASSARSASATRDSPDISAGVLTASAQRRERRTTGFRAMPTGWSRRRRASRLRRTWCSRRVGVRKTGTSWPQNPAVLSIFDAPTPSARACA